MNSVYPINKQVGRPIVFRGLKAQYIWWLAIGLVIALLLFAFLYIAGVPMLICVIMIALCATLWSVYVYRFNKRYGEHGMMKKMARQAIPIWIKCDQHFSK